jgi:hypothetical protein
MAATPSAWGWSAVKTLVDVDFVLERSQCDNNIGRGSLMKLSLRPTIVTTVVICIILGALALAAEGMGGYHLLQHYAFGAAEGSSREYFDYITVDSAARHVYLFHGSEVKVIDADNGSLIGNVPGLKQDHGVAIASEFGRGFITDGAQGKVIIFDLKTLRVVGEAKADHDADGVVYDPASKRIFAMNGDPNSCTVIDAKSGTVVGRPGKTGC